MPRRRKKGKRSKKVGPGVINREPIYEIGGKKIAYSAIQSCKKPYRVLPPKKELPALPIPPRLMVEGEELHPVEAKAFFKKPHAKYREYDDSHGRRGRKPFWFKIRREARRLKRDLRVALTLVYSDNGMVGMALYNC